MAGLICERLKILRDGCEDELVMGAGQAPQSHAPKAMVYVTSSTSPPSCRNSDRKDLPWDVHRAVEIPNTGIQIKGRIDRLDLASDLKRARVDERSRVLIERTNDGS